MDLGAAQNLRGVLKESLQIPKASPKTFILITLTLILPLSLAMLVHIVFTHPIVTVVPTHSETYDHPQWLKLFVIYFFFLILLFTFSLLSTAAVVFTVASLYTSKEVSFTATLYAIPSIFKRLFITFLYITLWMVVYNVVFVFCWCALFIFIEVDNPLFICIALLDLVFLYFGIHVQVMAIWHLASVVSVLEPIYGWEAIKKSRALMKGRTMMAMVFVFGYMLVCLAVGVFFIVIDTDGVFINVLVAALSIGVLVFVNLLGLLAQSVFYYVCKTLHRQVIDKTALNVHLGGYLGDYVPLESSIEMQGLKV